MAEKDSMQNQVEKDEAATATEVPVGETMPLIDVSPEHSREIVRVARAYHAKIQARLAIQKGRNGEDALQEQLLSLVKAENLSRDNSGKIKFEIEGVELELAPTKEKVKVKIKDE